MVAEKTVITFTRQVEVTDEMIDDLMCAALEGGITDWCFKITVQPKEDGSVHSGYGSDSISKGFAILLHEVENDHVDNPEEYTLTRDKFVKGLTKMYQTHPTYDFEMHDASDANLIIQYALFDKQVFN